MRTPSNIDEYGVSGLIVYFDLLKTANQKYEGYAMVLECILTGSGV